MLVWFQKRCERSQKGASGLYLALDVNLVESLFPRLFEYACGFASHQDDLIFFAFKEITTAIVADEPSGFLVCLKGEFLGDEPQLHMRLVSSLH